MPKLYTEQEVFRTSGNKGVSESECGRTAFRKDYSRLLHSPSFRRLQGKTQLFPGAESDFFRNRLTHSLEVAQIASGIADMINFKHSDLGIDRDLVQFAAIAHDLGHPPFGHNGEEALDELMCKHGGFEGNAQTLHILACTESKAVQVGEGEFRTDLGLDLTYRTLASVLKYDNEIPEGRPEGSRLVKGYYAAEAALVAEIKRLVAPGYSGPFKTIECYIMDLADDIAYSSYDLEDSLHAGFVTPATLLGALFSKPHITKVVTEKTNETLAKHGYDELGEDELLKLGCNYFPVGDAELDTDEGTGDTRLDDARYGLAIHEIDELFSKNAQVRTMYTAERVGRLIAGVELVLNEAYPALSEVRLSRDTLLEVEIFKHLNYELVIRSRELAIVQFRGKDIVTKIFKAILSSEGAVLPNHWKDVYEKASDKGKYRVACDFVSEMTDRFAIDFHDSLFGEGKRLYGPA